MSWLRRRPDLEDAELRDALAALRSLRSAPAPDTEARHLAQIRAATPPAAPAATTDRGARTALRLPRRSRFAFALLAALLATSGLAVAGELPAPVQNAAATAARTVGVELSDATGAVEAEPTQQGVRPEPAAGAATRHVKRARDTSERDAAMPSPHRRPLGPATPVNQPDSGERATGEDDGGAREPEAQRAPQSGERDGDASGPADGGQTEDPGASDDGSLTSDTPEQPAARTDDAATEPADTPAPAPTDEPDGDAAPGD